MSKLKLILNSIKKRLYHYLSVIFSAGIKIKRPRHFVLPIWGIVLVVGLIIAGTILLITFLKVPRETKTVIMLDQIRPGDLAAKTEEDREEMTSSSLTPSDSLTTMTRAAAVVKKRTEERRGKKITLIDEDAMLALLALPVDSKWKLANPQYHTAAYGDVETANLVTRYLDTEGREIRLELIDYIAAPAALQPLKMIFDMEKRKEDNIKQGKGEVVVYNDVVVLEEYNSRVNRAQISTIIKNRFILRLKCTGKKSQEIIREFSREFFAKAENLKK